MKPFYQDHSVNVHHADCLQVLRTLADSSVHSVVTDPPYAIQSRPVDLTAYEGHGSAECEQCSLSTPQDGFRLCNDCLETVKVQTLMGSPMLGMQSQNWHEKATHSRGYASNNNSEFQKWCSLWLTECLRVLKPGGHLIAFGGTRTWHRLTTAAEDAGFDIRDSLAWMYGTGFPKSLNVETAVAKTIDPDTGRLFAGPTSDRWAGWGTTLKPAFEPIVLARKPLDGTVAANALRHGTGAMNLRGCAIEDARGTSSFESRWPTNAYFDESQSAALDIAAGEPVTRFFWVAKPSGSERVKVNGAAHPTVKPLSLMRELTRLVTRPGQTVLDPFAGSGTTVEACLLEGFNVIAVERDASYLPLIRQRIDRRRDPLKAGRDLDPDDTPDLFDDIA